MYICKKKAPQDFKMTRGNAYSTGKTINMQYTYFLLNFIYHIHSASG